MLDQDEEDVGTWTKRFEQGKCVGKRGLWDHQLTVHKDQISTAFSHIFFQLQHVWQRSCKEECDQILDAYKCKDGSKDYPISLLRDEDKEPLINYLVKHQPSCTQHSPAEAKNIWRGVMLRLISWSFCPTVWLNG